MSAELDDQAQFDSGALVRVLGWYTLFYAISFVGYLGGSQGLWFWYLTLRRPGWAIPGWGFTAAWTILYGVIAAATWQVWKAEPSRARTTSLILLAIQLALSAFWPWSMFAMHQPIGSSVEAALLALTALATTISFWIVQPKAGGLMLLQFLWTLYVAMLDLALWVLNK